ncbi:MAG TPA: hypothetical protein VM029_02725 [Opitutaceae bacterium]|nr:hypothetical protein [Opitutaceae bacterium]
MKLQIPISKRQGSSKLPLRVSLAGPIVAEDGREYGELDAAPSEPAKIRPAAVPRHPFDLEERTARFGEAIVRFSKKIPRNPGNDRLIGQIVGCGTSVGANYCEANEYFLRMIAAAEPPLAAEARPLFREAKELHLIFCSMYRGPASS